ncbi:MAG: DUF4235 domain-containing protein [Actinomycetaceae bacterium]|nr:DUF4235 domain-containing protein [Arcanobacterium sp.]MDD7687452.1 DUF4235 domain-containing protein [Actinomycetaceae bacterium]MDY5272927.1 DUF4235 domain-containing protein [Arcanobacterium sp.]
MNLGWKLITLGVGAAAGLAAKVAVDVVWEKVLGNRKPTGGEEDLDQPFAQIVVFTAVTTIVSSVVAEAVKRSSARAYGRHEIKRAEKLVAPQV